MLRSKYHEEERQVIRIRIYDLRKEEMTIVTKNDNTKGPVYRFNHNNKDAKSRLERKSRFSTTIINSRK